MEGGWRARGRANCELSIVELLIVNCCSYFLGLFVSIVLTMLYVVGLVAKVTK